MFTLTYFLNPEQTEFLEGKEEEFRQSNKRQCELAFPENVKYAFGAPVGGGIFIFGMKEAIKAKILNIIWTNTFTAAYESKNLEVFVFSPAGPLLEAEAVLTEVRSQYTGRIFPHIQLVDRDVLDVEKNYPASNNGNVGVWNLGDPLTMTNKAQMYAGTYPVNTNFVGEEALGIQKLLTPWNYFAGDLAKGNSVAKKADVYVGCVALQFPALCVAGVEINKSKMEENAGEGSSFTEQEFKAMKHRCMGSIPRVPEWERQYNPSSSILIEDMIDFNDHWTRRALERSGSDAWMLQDWHNYRETVRNQNSIFIIIMSVAFAADKSEQKLTHEVFVALFQNIVEFPGVESFLQFITSAELNAVADPFYNLLMVEPFKGQLEKSLRSSLKVQDKSGKPS